MDDGFPESPGEPPGDDDLEHLPDAEDVLRENLVRRPPAPPQPPPAPVPPGPRHASPPPPDPAHPLFTLATAPLIRAADRGGEAAGVCDR